jgi:glycosyltransferase involved in cell wall biosynthesis
MHSEIKRARPALVSVLVITYNEEANIAACLEALRWAAEVFVVDSLSTDRTVEIAKSLGAKVYLHPFESYAKQWNWAFDNLPFAHDWTLIVDADEVIPAPLAEEIGRALAQPENPNDGFYLNRMLIFLGRPLKHGGLFPNWHLRLVKRCQARYEDRPINPHIVLNGATGTLKEPFYHRDNRPLFAWIERQNVYTDLEAEQHLCERFEGGYQSSISARFWGTQPERKRWIRLHVWNRIPLLLRPFFFFLRNYFLKGGFLDGREGFIHHVLWSFWVRFLIDVKILERQRRQGASLGAGNPASDAQPSPQPVAHELDD